MIAWLSGIVRFKSPDHIVLDVGGVGYQVFLSLNSYYKVPAIGDKLSLDILTYVREDQISLFGFVLPHERESHKHLMAVSGIGPKLALNILSGIKPDELAKAIATGDLKRLQGVSGVGKKIAERILIELKDKISLPTSGEAVTSAIPLPLISSQHDDLNMALTSLGYKKVEIDQILPKIPKDPNLGLETLIKEALKLLKPRGA